jgi:hypothetical protein
MEWRHIEWADIPSRAEFKDLTLDLLRRGCTNSDRMRDEIRIKKKLILKKATSHPNETPSSKFVNEHAWALEKLVLEEIIERTAEKEYRLKQPSSSDASPNA